MSLCISEGRSLYRIHDKTPQMGCHAVLNFSEGDWFNLKQWGIFWTVNEFDGPRLKQNVKRIISWAIDLDSGSKEQQLARIRSGPILPSSIIETGRGYHVYFDAKNGDPSNYSDIVERLVEFYSADKNAKDICRLLRVIGYLHWKGPEPKPIRSIYHNYNVYTEDEMFAAFPKKDDEPEARVQRSELKRELRVFDSGDLWEKVWRLDCEDALKRISGTDAMGMESISFKPTTNGNLNIYINGKGTSCWIDRNKRIGSLDKGGPSIYQWINWYHKDSKKSYELLKTHFKELFAK